MKKKGAVQQNQWITIVAAFGLGVIFLAVAAIILQALHNDSTLSCSNQSHTYNASTNICNSATNVSQTSPLTFSGNITQDGLVFMDNATSQLGTAGTVAGVSVLLLILALFGIYGYSKYKASR